MSRRLVSTTRLHKLIVPGFVAAASLATFYWYRRPIAPWQQRATRARSATLLQQYLPQAEFAGEVSTVTHAPADAIFAAMQQVTLADMPIANWIGTLRYLPTRLMGKSHTVAPDNTPFLQQVLSEGGNIVLGETPNQEYVIGAIGKFHNLFDQQIVPLSSSQEFLAFDRPDHQKLAMSFTIAPVAHGNRLTLTHGTHALSAGARAKFALYWLGIKPGGNFVTWLMLRAIKARAERVVTPSKRPFQSCT
jgi:hypothetical protein